MKVSGGENVLTASGVVAAVVLMAVFTALNFLSVRRLAHTNSTATWWKVGVPVLTIVALAIAGLHTSNFTAADGFGPAGPTGVLAAVSTSGIIFARLGFEQADQLAGESANPKRDIPRAVIGAIAIGAVTTSCFRSSSSPRSRPRRSGARGRARRSPRSAARSPTSRRSSASAGSRRSCTSTR